MPNSCRCLHRQPQGFRGQTALKELVPLGDGAIITVSNVRGDGPTVPKILAIAIGCRNNGHVDVVIDTLQQFQGLVIEVNAFIFRRV